MGFTIYDAKSEESMSLTYEGFGFTKGRLIRGTIKYLQVLSAKDISRQVLMDEGIVDQEAVNNTQQDDVTFIVNWRARIDSAIKLLTSWCREQSGRNLLDLGGIGGFDIMRGGIKALTEIIDSPYHLDRIPSSCPAVLVQLRLWGLYHIITDADHKSKSTHEEVKQILFLLQKVDQYCGWPDDHRERVKSKSEAKEITAATKDEDEDIGQSLTRVFQACNEDSEVVWEL